MNSIRQCFLRIKERPAVIIFLAVATLVTSALEQFNSITREYGSISKLIEHDYLGTLSALAERITSFGDTPRLALLTFFTVLLLLIAVSAIMGISYAGCFHKLSQMSFDKPKRKHEFRTGIARHALKLSVYFFFVIVLSAFFIVALLYTVIPCILSVKLFLAGSSGIFFPMILVCILTVLVGVFAILFYSMYMTFTLPSIVCFRKGGFNVAFRMVNGYCWYLMPRTLLFLVICALLRVGLLALGYGSVSTAASVCILIATWGIRTFCYFFFLYFVFNTFSAMKSDMFGDE